MVELRKRKPAPEPVAAPPTKKRSSNLVKNAVDKAKNAILGDSTNGNSSSAARSNKVAIGDILQLENFGGEIETDAGNKTTLKQLVDDSQCGVVLFTYPKANTPGCATQACLFRDAYTHLTSTGLSIYGLSTDSPKSNTSFKNKQSLPYPLLCDPSATLISAIGFKKSPTGTTRGVFVVDKAGKVLAAEPGGPQATVDAVANLIKEGKITGASGGDNLATAQAVKATAEEAPSTEKEDLTSMNATIGTDVQARQTDIGSPPKMDEAPLPKTPSKEEAEAADTAADVAETAAKIDGDGVPRTQAEKGL